MKQYEIHAVSYERYFFLWYFWRYLFLWYFWRYLFLAVFLAVFLRYFWYFYNTGTVQKRRYVMFQIQNTGTALKLAIPQCIALNHVFIIKNKEASSNPQSPARGRVHQQTLTNIILFSTGRDQ